MAWQIMSLNIGTILGPYAVTAKIGEGGMGEVYRARDTTLDRDVPVSDDAAAESHRRSQTGVLPGQ